MTASMTAFPGLCVGLDPDIHRLPEHFSADPSAVAPFLTAIVESTRAVAAAYKINTAFFEQYGRTGIDALYQVREAVGSSYCIIDAKRGDIGNTSAAYARSVFEDLRADATTVAPYMGSDSVEPFLAYAGKRVYVLALTSNAGSADFQRLLVQDRPLFERVMHTALTWQGPAERGFVVGATHPQELAAIRQQFPSAHLLIPGVGAQGGDPHQIAKANAGGPALVNASRSILYADRSVRFAEAAAEEALRITQQLIHS